MQTHKLIQHRLSVWLKKITLLLAVLPLPCLAAQDIDRALPELIYDVLIDAQTLTKLQGQRIAVLGFQSTLDNRGCPALSRSLADRITAELNRYRRLIGVFAGETFALVERRSLETLETECSISQGANCPKVMDLLAPSDVLITGGWERNEQEFVLTIKALRVGERSTDLLATRQQHLSLNGLTQGQRACLQEQTITDAAQSRLIGAPTKAQLSFSGDYSGTATLDTSSFDSDTYEGPLEFPYRWQLQQDGEQVIGTIKVSLPDNTDSATYRIEGQIENGILHFHGKQFIDVADPDLWCMVAGQVTLQQNKDRIQLTGRWEPNLDVEGGCESGGGHIALVRETKHD